MTSQFIGSEVQAKTETCPVRRITPAGGHYFFGYYDKSPWDPAGRHLLAMRAEMADRQPRPEDRLKIGLIDPARPEVFEPLASTRAWNWQQGCMLQWLPDGRVLYNDRVDDRFVTVILDPGTGRQQTLPHPTYGVRHDGRLAMSLNFARLYEIRPGYGYAGLADPHAEAMAPEEDGIRQMDLDSGEARLLISLAELTDTDPPLPTEGVKHWLNHIQFSRDGDRFAFLHRWLEPELLHVGGWGTRLWTGSVNGPELCLLADDGMTSHYDWMDGQRILAWAQLRRHGCRYFIFHDRSDRVEIVGQNVFDQDGHCSVSPDGRFMLTDTYPDERGYRKLMIWDLQQQRLHEIERFYNPATADAHIRCDLHPRWSRDGRAACIDSIHEGFRAMYVIDVSSVTC